MASSNSPTSSAATLPAAAPQAAARGSSRPLRRVWAGVQWLLMLAITLLGLLAVTFFIGRTVPIDPVLAVVGDRATPDIY